MPPPSAGWNRSTLKALFDTAEQAEGAAAVLLAKDWTAGVQVQALQEVVEQDWVRITQSQFEPIAITPSFWIVPSWHEPPSQAQKVIRLDPGLAFGTGTHPTTRMCLRWIAAHAAPVRVLDYGCGSGILGIAALKLGAAAATAVDIDPQALEAARYNASRNSVALDVRDARAAPPGAADITIANILANPLRMLAPLLASHTRPGGRLALSGILRAQANDVMQAYAPFFDLAQAAAEAEWVCLAGTRRQAA
jgi:ribosomal protein L11 methyltransferase